MRNRRRIQIVNMIMIIIIMIIMIFIILMIAFTVGHRLVAPGGHPLDLAILFVSLLLSSF